MTSSDVYPTWNVEQSGEKKLYRINRNHPVIASFRDSLDDVDRQSFETVLALIESTFPTASLFYNFASNEENVSFAALEDNSFISVARTFFASLKQNGRDEDTILSIMRNAEPFHSRWQDTLNALGIEE